MATLRESVAMLQPKDSLSAEWPALAESSPDLTQSDLLPLRVQLPAEQPVVTATRNLYSAAVRDTVSTVNVATVDSGHTNRDEEDSRKRYEHGRKNETRMNEDGFTLVGKKKKKTLNKKAIIGTGNVSVKAIAGRYLAMFVSRLCPDTSEDDMDQYIREVHGISSTCTKLKTKHTSYASFKIEVRCDNVTEFCSPEKWPACAYVRRFFSGKKT